MNRRYVLIAFGILLIGYGVFVVWSIIQYTAYYNNTMAWLEAIGIPKGVVEPKPYTFFWYGQATIILALTILFAGIIILPRCLNMNHIIRINYEAMLRSYLL